MGVVVPLNYPATPDSSKQNRTNLMKNKDRGFAALYRSLLDDDWTKDAYLMAAWVRLVLRASSTERTVNYNGQDWTVGRGQLVIIPGRFANELRDRNGKPLSRQAVVRMLEWFESRNMIVKAGYDKGTVITICNYDPYQSLVSPVLSGQPTEQQSEHLPEHHNASNGAALSGDAVQPAGQPTEHQTVPEEQPCKTTIKEQDLKDSCPCADKSALEPDEPEDDFPDEAFIRERRKSAKGKSDRKLWGTKDDATCAQWFIDTLNKAFESRGLAKPKDPDHILWTNEIRLMRTIDGRNHHDICKLFAFVCKHRNELSFCQAPAKLREKWDSLSLKMADVLNQQNRNTTTKPMSNIAAAQAKAQQIIAEGRGGYDDNTIL